MEVEPEVEDVEETIEAADNASETGSIVSKYKFQY